MFVSFISRRFQYWDQSKSCTKLEKSSYKDDVWVRFINGLILVWLHVSPAPAPKFVRTNAQGWEIHDIPYQWYTLSVIQPPENRTAVEAINRVHIKFMKVIPWVVPLPSNSDHQDYYIFSRESLWTFISTITGKGDNPSYTMLFWVPQS